MHIRCQRRTLGECRAAIRFIHSFIRLLACSLARALSMASPVENDSTTDDEYDEEYTSQDDSQLLLASGGLMALRIGRQLADDDNDDEQDDDEDDGEELLVAAAPTPFTVGDLQHSARLGERQADDLLLSQVRRTVTSEIEETERLLARSSLTQSQQQRLNVYLGSFPQIKQRLELLIERYADDELILRNLLLVHDNIQDTLARLEAQAASSSSSSSSASSSSSSSSSSLVDVCLAPSDSQAESLDTRPTLEYESVDHADEEFQVPQHCANVLVERATQACVSLTEHTLVLPAMAGDHSFLAARPWIDGGTAAAPSYFEMTYVSKRSVPYTYVDLALVVSGARNDAPLLGAFSTFASRLDTFPRNVPYYCYCSSGFVYSHGFGTTLLQSVPPWSVGDTVGIGWRPSASGDLVFVTLNGKLVATLPELAASATPASTPTAADIDVDVDVDAAQRARRMYAGVRVRLIGYRSTTAADDDPFSNHPERSLVLQYTFAGDCTKAPAFPDVNGLLLEPLEMIECSICWNELYKQLTYTLTDCEHIFCRPVCRVHSAPIGTISFIHALSLSLSTHLLSYAMIVPPTISSNTNRHRISARAQVPSIRLHLRDCRL